MREVEVIIEETFKIERTLKLYLTNEQYEDLTNGDNPIDSLFKHSHCTKDFLNRAKRLKERTGNCGFCKASISSLTKDLKNKDFVCFDILYENLGE